MSDLASLPHHLGEILCSSPAVPGTAYHSVTPSGPLSHRYQLPLSSLAFDLRKHTVFLSVFIVFVNFKTTIIMADLTHNNAEI